MNGKRLSWLLWLPALASAVASDAYTLIYRESRGERVELHAYVVRALGDGFRVELTRRTPEGLVHDLFLCDRQMHTLSWEYASIASDSRWRAVRTGHTIVLTGMHRGEEVNRTYRIDAAPWKQAFSIDFADFAAAGGKHRFWSIGTSGPGEMKAAKFVARVHGMEKVRVAGQEVEALRLRVALQGVRSVFWHGDYWFRRGDWRYLLYRGKSGLFSGDTVKELVSETPLSAPAEPGV